MADHQMSDPSIAALLSMTEMVDEAEENTMTRLPALRKEPAEAIIDFVRPLIRPTDNVIHWGCIDGQVLQQLRDSSTGQITGVYAECIPVTRPIRIMPPGSPDDNITWYRALADGSTNTSEVTTFASGISKSLLQNKPNSGYQIAIVGEDLIQNGERNDTKELLRLLKTLLSTNGILVIPWSLGSINKGGVLKFKASLFRYGIQKWHYVPANARCAIDEDIEDFAEDLGYGVYSKFQPDIPLDDFEDLRTTVPAMFLTGRARGRVGRMTLAVARWITRKGSAHFEAYQKKGVSVVNMKDLLALPPCVSPAEFACQRWPSRNPMVSLARELVDMLVYVDSEEDLREHVDGLATEPGADAPRIMPWTGHAVLRLSRG